MPCQPNDFLCHSGDLFLPPSVRRILETYIIGNDTTLFYVTFWTVMHLVSGLLVAYFKSSYMTGFIIHGVWEMYQIIVKNTNIYSLRGYIDIVTDTVFFMFGMFVYKNRNQLKNSID